MYVCERQRGVKYGQEARVQVILLVNKVKCYLAFYIGYLPPGNSIELNLPFVCA